MQITQIRNATIIVQFGEHRILVDPMLADQHALPPLRLSGGMRRNPTVPLPDGASAALDGVTHCLITHCQRGHFDHLDRAGKRFLRERAIPVFCTAHDAPYLAARGLHVQVLDGGGPLPFLGGQISMVPCIHGHGMVGRLMEHGTGYVIEMPGEPSLYLAGDTVLTDGVRAALARHRPAVSVLPAGGARFDLGGEIIMGPDQVLEFARLGCGQVVANHLEALSHCAPTRASLRKAARDAGLDGRVHVPDDGASLSFGLSARAEGIAAAELL